MKPNPKQAAEALKVFETEFRDRWSGYKFNYKKARDQIERMRTFNRNWDEGLRFYVERVEEWMDQIPAVWIKPLPYPHPASEHRSDDDWNDFLAEQRRQGGREAAYLTNGIREEKKHIQQIVVSRMWLLTALTYDGKVGSEDFWETVLDEVVRELPDWTVDDGGDQLSPDIKTLRNMISVRQHKRFLRKIVGLKISQDG